MPRTSADYDTRTRTARLRLPPRADPYYRSAGVGKLLGYKRLNAESNGAWIVRTREAGRYTQRVIGQADDFTQPDGRDVFNFEQALRFVTDPNAARKSAAGNVTVADALKTYYDTMKSEHREQYRRIGTRHIAPTLGGYRVDKLTKAKIDAWLLSMVREDTKADPDAARRSKDTANRVLSHLKAALNNAFDDESNGIASDAAWRRVKAFEGVTRARTDHDLESAQVQTLIDRAAKFRKPLANLIQAAFLTGARLGELRDADVSDFNPKGGTLRVDGKTGPRFISLTDETVTFFAAITKGAKRNAPLLPDQHGGRWPSGIQFGRQMARAVKAAELPGGKGGVTIYTMRHVHISRALEAGVPINLVAENCGTSVKMITEHYAHVLARTRKATLERGGPSLRVVRGGKAA